MGRDNNKMRVKATGVTRVAGWVLVDPRGHIRGHYDSNDIHKLDELVRDARFLARTMM